MITEFHQPSGSVCYRDRMAIVRVIGSGKRRRKAIRKGEGLKGRYRRVARAVYQIRTLAQ